MLQTNPPSRGKVTVDGREVGEAPGTFELPPGKHTLQLLLGDAAHVPNDPPLMSKKITVIVP